MNARTSLLRLDTLHISVSHRAGIPSRFSAGLVVSSAQLLSSESAGTVCLVLGAAGLAIPSLFLVLVLVVLFRFARPTSVHRRVAWSQADSWVTFSPEHQTAGDAAVYGTSRLKRVIGTVKLGFGGLWLDRWMPLFEDFKGEPWCWIGMLVVLLSAYIFGIVLSFGSKISCQGEQVCSGVRAVVHVCSSLLWAQPVGSSSGNRSVSACRSLLSLLRARTPHISCSSAHSQTRLSSCTKCWAPWDSLPFSSSSS